jgi:hypothetical protein
MDNKGFGLQLMPEDLIQLVRHGYRFSDETQVFESENTYDACLKKGESTAVWLLSNLNEYEMDVTKGCDLLDVYRDVLKANIWPSSSKRPADLAEGLKLSVRVGLTDRENNRAMALNAYLFNAGMEACVRVAGGSAQWVKLTLVFPVDELKPYLKIMPKAAKGLVLEQSLGM